jgi:hypothetical protein
LLEITRVCGRPQGGYRRNGLDWLGLAAYFPARIVYGID